MISATRSAARMSTNSRFRINSTANNSPKAWTTHSKAARTASSVTRSAGRLSAGVINASSMAPCASRMHAPVAKIKASHATSGIDAANQAMMAPLSTKTKRSCAIGPVTPPRALMSPLIIQRGNDEVDDQPSDSGVRSRWVNNRRVHNGSRRWIPIPSPSTTTNSNRPKNRLPKA